MTFDRESPALSAERLVAMLLNRKLITVGDIVDGDVRLLELGGRNLNHSVTWTGAPGLFVKQAPSLDGDAAAGVTAEAALYRLAGRVRNPALSGSVPHLVFFERAHRLLATRLLPSGDPPDKAPAFRSPETERKIAAELARALAHWHTAFSTPPSLGRRRLSRRPPWFLGIHLPTPDWLAELSSAQLDLISIVQGDATTCLALDQLRESWVPSAVIHGDVRLANVLVEPTGRDSSTVRVVDWEFMSWGDPMWDVGSVFQSYLIECIVTEPWGELASLADARRAFEQRLPAAQQQIRQVWSTYVDHTCRAHDEASLLRAGRYSAVRLLEAAYEWSVFQESLPREALGAIQLSLNIMARPEAALRGLFGFDRGE